MDEILDDLDLKSNTTIRYADFVPVIAVALLFIWSMYIWSIKGYILNDLDFMSYGLVIIALLTYFKNKKIYLTILLVTFSLEFFGFLYWTPYHYRFLLFGIPMQPISFLLLIALCISNSKGIEEELGSTAVHKEKQSDQIVRKFKDRHINSADAELQNILDSNGFRKEIKEAARQILNERNVKTE